MKKLLLIPAFLLFGAISFTANAETALLEDIACTYQTTDGNYSVTAPTCRAARAAFMQLLRDDGVI